MLSRRSFLVSAGAGMAAGSLVSSMRVRQPPHQDPARHPALDREVRGREGPRRHAAQGVCRRLPRNRIRRLLRQDPADLAQAHEGHRLLAGQHARRRRRHRQERATKIIADAKALGLKYIVCSSPGVSPEKDKLPWEERMKAVDLTRLEVERRALQQVRQAGGGCRHGVRLSQPQRRIQKVRRQDRVRSPVRA